MKSCDSKYSVCVASKPLLVILVIFTAVTAWDFRNIFIPASDIPQTATASQNQAGPVSPDDERMLRAPREGEGHPLFNRAEPDRAAQRSPGIINKLLEHFSIATTLVILIVGATVLFMGPFIGYLFYLRKKHPEKYS